MELKTTFEATLRSVNSFDTKRLNSVWIHPRLVVHSSALVYTRLNLSSDSSVFLDKWWDQRLIVFNDFFLPTWRYHAAKRLFPLSGIFSRSGMHRGKSSMAGMVGTVLWVMAIYQSPLRHAKFCIEYPFRFE